MPPYSRTVSRTDCPYKRCLGQCPTLASPTNGAVSGSNSLGDVATFTCNSGYNMVGGSTRTCQTDLTWSGSSPTCTAVQCPALTAPTNGAVGGTNSYGDVATFTCDTGYGLAGASTRTCQADTTWSGTSPTCTVGQCPALASPTNGAVSGSNSLGDVATFTCNSGYNMAGGSTRTCQTDLTWSGSSPTCTAVQCPALTAPTNGAVSGTNSYGDVATFTCDPGYGLVGASTRTCQADTTWSGISPTCTVGQCPAPTSPTNGGVTGSNNFGDTITFSCDTGYNMAGASSLSCQSDLTWSASPPTCTVVQCSVPSAPTNGAVIGSNSYGDVASFTCDPGYILAGVSTLTCQADGTWNGPSPTCAVGQCPAPTAPTNGGVTGSNSFGDTITFTCDAGYNMAGASTLTFVQCSIQTPPDNGDITGSNSYQDIVRFTCHSGYELAGAASITCQADGTWSDSTPSCGAVECPMLSAPVDGAMTGSNFYQGLVQFSCIPGYELDGRVQCPTLTAPANGAMTGNNFYQDIVRFTCDSGYDRVGTASVTCQADRSWNGVVPSCTRVQCPALTAPANGEMTGSTFYQDEMRFTCDVGYELVGSSTLTCQADRTWDGVAPSCTRVQCPMLPSPINGGLSGTNFYMDTLLFSCDLGYNLIGYSSSTCRADQSWSANAPSCNDIDECLAANAGCDHVCTNTAGTFHCSCVDGYNLNADSFSCDDVDECSSANGGCQQLCINVIGSFQCTCQNGYTLNNDGFNCDDVDECASANGGCEHNCKNSISSFQCSCVDGYKLNADGLACDDINECGTANGGCGQNCSNTIGSFQCFCSNGYVLNADGFTCDDIDECDAANGGCEQFCNNTIASFNCYCATGYSLNVDRFACDGLPPPPNISLSLASGESVIVNWSQPARTLVLGYRVWLTDKETMSVIASQHLSQSASSAAFSSLVPATEYVVAVSCVSAFFEGPEKDVTIVTG
ncbi:CUB and sushi domain-containing protein 3-like [Branchiostoma lanceolatum]|uniref:CUB and sushi domain-containing protein 3-like n=1 Tax=Branchiostoma lanceolatum TaxID=7740 RepID=UPI003451E880